MNHFRTASVYTVIVSWEIEKLSLSKSSLGGRRKLYRSSRFLSRFDISIRCRDMEDSKFEITNPGRGGLVSYIFHAGIASVEVWNRSVRGDARISDKRLKKLPFPLHDDISGTGSRIETNQKAHQRGRFPDSDDRRFVDRKSLSSKLRRFKVFLILIAFDRASRGEDAYLFLEKFACTDAVRVKETHLRR